MNPFFVQLPPTLDLGAITEKLVFPRPVFLFWESPIAGEAPPGVDVPPPPLVQAIFPASQGF